MIDRPPPRTPLAVWVITGLAICVAAVALRQSVQWYGHPFPGVLITSDGVVSSIGLPTWSGIEQGLRFPDRIEAIEGVPLVSSRGEFASRTWDRTVDAAVARGLDSVHVKVLAGDRERELELRLDRLDPWSWWLYAGTTLFMGGLYALAAAVAAATGTTSALARTFSKFALLAALFFLTIFDAHTTRTLVPLFHITYAWGPFALIALALRLPDDVPFVARHPWVLPALDAAGLIIGATVVTRDLLGESVTPLQSLCTILFGGAMIAFVVVLGVRYMRAVGTRRETLRVLFRATATPYAIVGGGNLVTLLSSRGSTAAFLAIPALALAPIATGVAVIRHDLWGSRALLSRVLARSIAGAVACVVAVGVGAAFAASVGVPFRGALVAAAAGAVVSAALVFYAARAVERTFFPAVAEYKPTIEQLSEELTSITDPKEVALAVERTVRRWLPCEQVAFRTVAHAEETRPSEPPPAAHAERGELCIVASFGGRNMGSLVVGRKRGGALFTTDDLDLLGTIANQAALALAHAHSYAELERRRRQQAAAWQTERLALIETVAAEIAHEVRYPINFFRSVFRRDPKNAQLDPEEIDIGCEEVDRLERLVAGLRRMVGHRIERRTVAVSDLAARVEMLLRDALVGRSLELDVPPDAALRCDPDQVVQIIVNLVANAIEATGARGRIGVEWCTAADGSELVVWDDGPGFESDASQLFAPWFTTKPRGTGLGLAITQRIVRAHGWSIDALRTNAQTRFVVTIPASDVVDAERRVASDPSPLPGTHGDEHHEDSDRR
jgi:signal transduction histidine kinase